MGGVWSGLLIQKKSKSYYQHKRKKGDKAVGVAADLFHRSHGLLCISNSIDFLIKRLNAMKYLTTVSPEFFQITTMDIESGRCMP